MKNFFYISFLFVVVSVFGQETLFSGKITINERIVTGNVTSLEDGLPLPGATIIVDKTTKGTHTDLYGNYSLKNVTPNDTLVFSFVGMKTQKIRADKDTINVGLQGGVIIETVLPYEPYYRHQPVYARVFRVDKNPKKAFRKNKENNQYLIFISEQISHSDFSENELKFEQEYNIMYVLNHFDVQYSKKHNKLTFKHLNKKYKKTWQTQIRKDAIGLDDFLKRNN